MVKVNLCWMTAGNWNSEHVREGCSSGVIPGTGYMKFPVDVDISSTGFSDLVKIAMDSGSLPPLHHVTGFCFHGRYMQEGATLKTYSVKRGDTIFMDVRREKFELQPTGPPNFNGNPTVDDPDFDEKE